MMDNLTIQASEADGGRGLADRRRAPRSSSSSTAPRASATRGSSEVQAICAAHGALRGAGRRVGRRARAHLADAQGGVRGDGPAAPELLRPGRRDPAHEAARGPRPHRGARRAVRAAGGQRLPRRRRQPAPARLLRRQEGGRRRAGRGARRARSSSRASRRAARSRASTASASTRSATCRRCSPRPTWTAFQKLRCAFDPDGRTNPGKVMPTPRLCGEVPGPYRRAPARARGPGGTVLMVRRIHRRPVDGRRGGRGPARRRGLRPARAHRRQRLQARLGQPDRAAGRRAAHDEHGPRGRAQRGRLHRRSSRPALPFATPQAELAAKGQMLALDPPGRGGDGRRRVRDRGLRAAAPPLRRAARPRPRRPARARRRQRRAGGRQGHQERRRLRPRQALHRRRSGRSGSSAEIAVRLHPLPAGHGDRGRAQRRPREARGRRRSLRARAARGGRASTWAGTRRAARSSCASAETASARVAQDAAAARRRGARRRPWRRTTTPSGRASARGSARPTGSWSRVARRPGACGSCSRRRRTAGATLVGRAALGPVVAAPRPRVRRRRDRPRHELRERLAPAAVTRHRRSGGRPRGRRSLGTGRPGPPRAHAPREGALRPDRRLRPGLFVGGL